VLNNSNFPSFAAWIAVSVACILLFSKIFGAIALIFVIEGNNAFKVGNYQKYENSKRTAMILLIVGVVIGLMFFGFNILYALYSL